jgi:uncharacterized membrane protein YkvA (DUF1232 family)
VPLLCDLRGWAHRIKRDALARKFARRQPNTTWLAKLLALVVVTYVPI